MVLLHLVQETVSMTNRFLLEVLLLLQNFLVLLLQRSLELTVPFYSRPYLLQPAIVFVFLKQAQASSPPASHETSVLKEQLPLLPLQLLQRRNSFLLLLLQLLLLSLKSFFLIGRLFLEEMELFPFPADLNCAFLYLFLQSLLEGFAVLAVHCIEHVARGEMGEVIRERTVLKYIFFSLWDLWLNCLEREFCLPFSGRACLRCLGDQDSFLHELNILMNRIIKNPGISFRHQFLMEGGSGSNNIIPRRQMNKENSMTVENQMSTEIGDTLKSYSSKFRQIKQMRAQNSTCLLPVKLERAAVAIQRFWRQRMLLRHQVLREIKESLSSQIELILFENQALAGITSAYEADCQARRGRLKARALEYLRAHELQASGVIQRLVGVTLQMEKRKIEEEDLEGLQTEKDYWRQRAEELQAQKDQLEELISGQVQEEEAEFMKCIKQQNLRLLKATKQRGELQKQLREHLVEACREDAYS